MAGKLKFSKLLDTTYIGEISRMERVGHFQGFQVYSGIPSVKVISQVKVSGYSLANLKCHKSYFKTKTNLQLQGSVSFFKHSSNQLFKILNFQNVFSIESC